MVVYRSSSLLLRKALGDGMAAQAGSDAFPQSNAIQLIDGLVLRIYAEVWSPHPLSHASRLTVGLVPQLCLPTWISEFMVIAFVGSFMPYRQFSVTCWMHLLHESLPTWGIYLDCHSVHEDVHFNFPYFQLPFLMCCTMPHAASIINFRKLRPVFGILRWR